jgi:hypothetical protein
MHTLPLLIGALIMQSPSGIERWRQDVAVARDEFLAKDMSYSPKSKAQARAVLDRLWQRVPVLSEQAIVAELARAAALADNGHTRAYLLRNRGWWRRYPLRLWKFSDGWHVVAVRPGLEDLLGAKALRVAQQPIARAEAALRPLYGGPDTWASYMASYSLTSPDALLGMGVLKAGDRVALGLEKDGRSFQLELDASAEPRRETPEESWWFLTPDHPGVSGWRQVIAGTALPQYLTRADNWYDVRRCDGGDLYFTFSRSEDQPGRPTLAEFGTKLLQLLQASNDARLIIDLRFNTGGNLMKTRGLFQAIARSAHGQTKGRLFLLIGPSTFSAGITPAAILKQDGRPILVGSRPGDRETFWAEGGNIRLPNSGINMHFADRAHVYGRLDPTILPHLTYLKLNAGDLSPDLKVAVTFADYMAGRDPLTERIRSSKLVCTSV